MDIGIDGLALCILFSDRKGVYMKYRVRFWQFDYLLNKLILAKYTSIIDGVMSNHASCDVLEIGCGNARWRVLFPSSSKYVGMDIVDRPGVDVVANAEQMPFEAESFDVIFSNAVLEHIQDVAQAASEIHRILRPGGHLILGTHGVWPVHCAPHDYRRWTSYGLLWEFRKFCNINVAQVGGATANRLMLVNVYLRKLQESSSVMRFIIMPFIVFNNILGLSAGKSKRSALLAVYYIVTASK